MKECAGNDRIKYYTSKGITCWSGNDDDAYEARHDLGANGVISVASNLIPGLFNSLMSQRNDQLASDLLPLIDWLFHEPNPIPLNTALAMLGIIKPIFRMPYIPTSRIKREEGAKLLKRWIDHIPNHRGVNSLKDKDFHLVSSY